LEWLSAMVFAIFCVFLFKLGQKWSKNSKKQAKLKKPEISLLFASFRSVSVIKSKKGSNLSPFFVGIGFLDLN
jgi:hypothetical protein